MKKLISAAAIAVFTSTLPAFAEKIPLSRISAYFNSFTTAEANFTQFNGDGSQSTGKLYIKRPGRVRFEYDGPSTSLVMAGGGKVAIFDAKSNSNPEEYPLRRTPLSIILARKVDLDRAKMVVAHVSSGAYTTVTAQDPDNPEYGSIDLTFSDNPVRLVQWVIDNGAGDQTKVVLDELKTGVELSTFLFNIIYEAEKWNK